MENNLKSNGPQNLNDAIQRLEKATTTKAGDLKGLFDEEIKEIRRAIEDIKPHLNELKDEALRAVKERTKDSIQAVEDVGKKIDQEVHKSPWMAMGLVAFVAFLIGLLVSRKD